MNDNTYQITADTNVLLHWPHIPKLLGDVNDISEKHLDTEAMIASGDAMIMLATALDEITGQLDSNPEAARLQIEAVIRKLLYIQRRYKLVRKAPEYHQ